ncbi:unnamed protein product [Calypogeia fissa]
MDDTDEKTTFLEERQSLPSSQGEGSPIAHVFRSFDIGDDKSVPAETLTGRNYLVTGFCSLGMCSILGIVLLGWRYHKFDAIWRLWQVDKPEYDFRTGWQENEVNISIVERALESGAVCLDGSPPAYLLDRGSGEGANNWLIFHEGGGWCQNAHDCLKRTHTYLGSSTMMPPRQRLEGILSSSPIDNPDFYNWNRVYLKYCDGGSFSGDVSDPMRVRRHTINGTAPVVNLFFRGQRIWKALMEELMEKGMKNAQNALLSGCSAGGLAAILHCDQYRDLMPKTTLVKCMSDAGFFLDIPDISGVQTIEALYGDVVQLHDMAETLPKYCTSEREASRCLFPEYIIPGLKTPFFMLNSAYDVWQIMSILVPSRADPKGIWNDCKNSLSLCSDAQLKVVHGFRDSLLEKLQPLLEREKDGAFIDSCYLHCQALYTITWNGPSGPKVDSKTSAKVVGHWYFERNSTKVVDCPYPCNPYPDIVYNWKH